MSVLSYAPKSLRRRPVKLFAGRRAQLKSRTLSLQTGPLDFIRSVVLISMVITVGGHEFLDAPPRDGLTHVDIPM